MSEILPVDLVNIFLGEIEANRRPEDGKLHASGDLCGSLRHSMLRLAGVKDNQRPIAQDIRLMHGTLWHDWFHAILVKAQVPFMFEVKLDDAMPEGWSGTADWVFYNPNRNAYVLGDLKTAKGEALYWINTKGAKEEHIWQLSAYWHALVKQGWPMIKGFGIMYWPMNDAGGNVPIEPIVQDCNPLPEDVVIGRMEERWALCKAYLQEYEKTGELVNSALADEIEREQRISYDKNRGIFNVSLYPHWSTQFCPYDPPLCACKEQKVTKIGHYLLDGEYVPRKGYEVLTPLVRPSPADFVRKGKEHGSGNS